MGIFSILDQNATLQHPLTASILTGSLPGEALNLRAEFFLEVIPMANFEVNVVLFESVQQKARLLK